MATTPRIGQSCRVEKVELAHFLRNRRTRLDPTEMGLQVGGRRLTPGLRREEVAQLAGISADYYMRLEQARSPNPSRQVLTALGRALRMSRDEQNYLLRLAGLAPTLPAERQVSAGVRSMLNRLDDVPAMVLDTKYDILAWNRMAAVLMTDFESLPERERNTLRWTFGQHHAWLQSPDGCSFARKCVADLRMSGHYQDNPEVRALVDELLADSHEFAELWAAHEIEVQCSAIKRTVHPIVGYLELHCETLLIPGVDQRLMMFTAEPGSASCAALKSLSSLAAKPKKRHPCQQKERRPRNGSCG